MFSARPLRILFWKPLISTFPRKKITTHCTLTKKLKQRFTKTNKQTNKLLKAPKWLLETLPDILKAIDGESCYVTHIPRASLWKWQRGSYIGEALSSLTTGPEGWRGKIPKLLWVLNKLTFIISGFTWSGIVENKSRMLTMAPRFPEDELPSCTTFSVLSERFFRYVGSFLSWEGLLIKA